MDPNANSVDFSSTEKQFDNKTKYSFNDNNNNSQEMSPVDKSAKPPRVRKHNSVNIAEIQKQNGAMFSSLDSDDRVMMSPTGSVPEFVMSDEDDDDMPADSQEFELDETRNMELFDPSMVFISIHRCQYWDEKDVVRKGKMFLTSTELFFKCSRMPFVKLRLALREITDVKRSRSYRAAKNKIESFVVIETRSGRTHAFFKFKIPKNIIKNLIMELVEKNKSLESQSSLVFQAAALENGGGTTNVDGSSASSTSSPTNEPPKSARLLKMNPVKETFNVLIGQRISSERRDSHSHESDNNNNNTDKRGSQYESSSKKKTRPESLHLDPNDSTGFSSSPKLKPKILKLLTPDGRRPKNNDVFWQQQQQSPNTPSPSPPFKTTSTATTPSPRKLSDMSVNKTDTQVVAVVKPSPSAVFVHFEEDQSKLKQKRVVANAAVAAIDSNNNKIEKIESPTTIGIVDIETETFFEQKNNKKILVESVTSIKTFQMTRRQKEDTLVLLLMLFSFIVFTIITINNLIKINQVEHVFRSLM